MSTSEQKIIVDYLSRKRWFYICGAIFHLSAFCVKELSLLGIMGGGALVLAGELRQNGGNTARTLLALPLASKQLANSWRFVALILPIVLYFLVLILANAIRPALGATSMSFERFVIIALIQTGIIGTMFFALAGIQNQAIPITELAHRVQLCLSGLLPALSILALFLLIPLAPSTFSEITTGHAITGILLAVATISSWFRAETLVSRSAARFAFSSPKSHSRQSSEDKTPWQGFGGFSYLFKHISGRISFIFIIMYFAFLFIGKYLRSLNSSNTDGSSITDNNQIGFLIPVIGLIVIIQFIPSLRVIRTLPQRLSTITHYLVFWPFSLMCLFAFATLLIQSMISGGSFDWNGYLMILIVNSLILIGLPMILRFGFGLKVFIPIIVLLNVSIAISGVVERLFDSELYSHWPTITALIAVILMLVWLLTFRALNSSHPWRNNLIKLSGIPHKM